VDRVALFVAPIVLGQGLSWCMPPGTALAGVPRGRVLRFERAGDDGMLLVDLGR